MSLLKSRPKRLGVISALVALPVLASMTLGFAPGAPTVASAATTPIVIALPAMPESCAGIDLGELCETGVAVTSDINGNAIPTVQVMFDRDPTVATVCYANIYADIYSGPYEGIAFLGGGSSRVVPCATTTTASPPLAPTVVDDPAVQGDAHYVLPADTASLDWTLNADGSVTVVTKTGYEFSDGTTTKSFPAPTDLYSLVFGTVTAYVDNATGAAHGVYTNGVAPVEGDWLINGALSTGFMIGAGATSTSESITLACGQEATFEVSVYGTKQDTRPRANIQSRVTRVCVPTVSRLSGTDRYATAVAISQGAFPTVGNGVPVAYIATGENFPDALAGGAAAAYEGGPLLLVNTDEIPANVAAELTRLKPKKIVIEGDTGVVSQSVATALATFTTGAVTRNGGIDRYETALLTSQHTFPNGYGGSVAIATGEDYPDALSAGSLFAKFPGPILLNDPTGTITGAVKAELARLHPAHVFLLGGTDVVPAQVATDVAALGYSVERLSGLDRYDTSLAIAEKSFPSSTHVDNVIVATGMNFPDGLAAGPLARTSAAPLMLVNGTCWNPNMLAYVKSLSPATITLVGGSDVLADSVGTLTACTA